MDGKALKAFFEQQLNGWEEAGQRYKNLQKVKTKDVTYRRITFKVQFNPARITSAKAKTDARNVAKRPCFLCRNNRPDVQTGISFGQELEILVNPFPILPVHFTIAAKHHQPQEILSFFGEIHLLLEQFPCLTVFYNGPRSGASAPDHMHLQAGFGITLPVQNAWEYLKEILEIACYKDERNYIAVAKGYACPVFVIKSDSKESSISLFKRLYDSMKAGDCDTEPDMNIVAWCENDIFWTLVFPRKKHRPECYYKQDDLQMLISPGALDMAGLIITPREKDFLHMTADLVAGILQEVSISDAEADVIIKRLQHNEKPSQQPQVSVGIVQSSRLKFVFQTPFLMEGHPVTGTQEVILDNGKMRWNGNLYDKLVFIPQQEEATFSLEEVKIGIDFHWERNETQVFKGELHLIIDNGKIWAINRLLVEDYLESVISSEMSASASLELLKTHAVISRSWLLYQMQHRQPKEAIEHVDDKECDSEKEFIRWYGRDSHSLFDVCADDHCQRYQGISRQSSSNVVNAVRATRGQVLYSGHGICDARFSKCCGGATEEYRYCWENAQRSYLVSVRDNSNSVAGRGTDIDELNLTDEKEASRWIYQRPQAFCNTDDKHILKQILNDYDQETCDFYRWRVEYTQDQLSSLITQKLGMSLGAILNLIPMERGKSGRISKLKIVGSERTIIIGKELEIRRVLSESHLYSSAFCVESHDVRQGIPQRFVLIGAGWGHGVGLCQIGAAVMGEQGYDYKQILSHYYKGAYLKQIYE